MARKLKVFRRENCQDMTYCKTGISARVHAQEALVSRSILIETWIEMGHGPRKLLIACSRFRSSQQWQCDGDGV